MEDASGPVLYTVRIWCTAEFEAPDGLLNLLIVG